MIELYIDAATAGNPGPSAIGIFIKGEGQLIKIGESIGESDNHSAEFIALVRGLKEAFKLSTGMISVRSDSKIVVASIEKEYVKNEAYKPYLEEALELSKKFDLFFIKWIPSSENRAADTLAKEALRKK
ncbi:ribonuclease HI family protein [Viridibacillus sp. NPDC096237]|uniref:ribonuclease HI family protein n=1 Tax=Viridibacillus sp. NPDC096237 TaxID=3390721 RepID=UPI003D030E71